MTLKVHNKNKKIQILTEDYEEKHVFFSVDSIAWINCLLQDYF